jgi:hypothetical protein
MSKMEELLKQQHDIVVAIGAEYKRSRDAAAQGEALAQYSLGVLYYKGQGVQQNFAAWWRIANWAVCLRADWASSKTTKVDLENVELRLLKRRIKAQSNLYARASRLRPPSISSSHTTRSACCVGRRACIQLPARKPRKAAGSSATANGNRPGWL